MKRVWLVALSAATVTASMAVAMDDASAARRSGINRGGVHAGNINRRPAAVYRAGVNRSGLAYRSGYGNRVGWNHNWNYWVTPGWAWVWLLPAWQSAQLRRRRRPTTTTAAITRPVPSSPALTSRSTISARSAIRVTTGCASDCRCDAGTRGDRSPRVGGSLRAIILMSAFGSEADPEIQRLCQYFHSVRSSVRLSWA